jgi:hypothetical protein
MGVEYLRLLIPERRDHRPSAEVLARFLNRLRRGRWLPDPGSEAIHYLEGAIVSPEGMCSVRRRPRTRERPARYAWSRVPHVVTPEWLEARRGPVVLRWHLSGDVRDGEPAFLRYPLSAVPEDGADYDLTVHWAQDFFEPVGFECADGLDTVCHPCATDLAFEEDDHDEPMIRAVCPRCGRAFDPCAQRVEIRSQLDGTDEVIVPGGIAHRFGVVVDCGKSFEGEDGRNVFHPALRALAEEELGVSLVEIGVIY